MSVGSFRLKSMSDDEDVIIFAGIGSKPANFVSQVVVAPILDADPAGEAMQHHPAPAAVVRKRKQPLWRGVFWAVIFCCSHVAGPVPFGGKPFGKVSVEGAVYNAIGVAHLSWQFWNHDACSDRTPPASAFHGWVDYTTDAYHAFSHVVHVPIGDILDWSMVSYPP